MRKLYTILLAAFTFGSAAAQKGNLVLTTPLNDVEYQVIAMSPNGKWACGNINDGNDRGFLWNLISGEVQELSMPGDPSYALAVSDDGTVIGNFSTTKGTPNNTPVETYGFFKGGKWHDLEIQNDANGAKVMRDGYAQAVSADGRVIAGIGNTKAANETSHFVPLVWKDGKLEIVEDSVGSVMAISNDGKVLGGWTNHPVKQNRTSVIWRMGEDGKYKKTYVDPSSPYCAGPFAYVRGFSHNGKYAVGLERVWDVEADTCFKVYEIVRESKGFQFHGVSNDGSAYGYITDDNGRAQAMILNKDEKVIVMRDYLEQQGVDLSNFPTLYMMTKMSADEKTFSFIGFDQNSLPRSIVVKLDVDTLNMAPSALRNRTLAGVNANCISWNAPLKNKQNVSGYNLYRNAVKLNKELITSCSYIDEQLAAGEYTYEVSAVYGDKESEKSLAMVTNVEALQPQQPRDVTALQSSYNDVRMFWEFPKTNMPAIRYYADDDNFASLGGGDYNMEGAITARKEELAIYKQAGYQIAEITFIPASKQKSWTVNFYTTDNQTVPFYSEVIESDKLIYGMENTYQLKQPVAIPDGKDVIMGIAVDVEGYGGFKILGMVAKKADPKYTDLIRKEGEQNFYSMYDSGQESPDGAYEYNICWAMGMNFAKADAAASNTVKQYKIFVNNEEKATCTDKKYRLENMADGTYTLGVAAEYADGTVSTANNTTIVVKGNNNIFKKVNPSVKVDEATAVVSWETPTDNDATVISYANTPLSGGVVGAEQDQFSYMAATIYGAEKLKNFDGFEITGFRFYPLSDADFTFFLKVDGQEVIDIPLDRNTGYTKNKWNTVKLEKPIRINRYSEYTLVLDCYDVTPKTAPLGMDSEICYPNMSDLFSTDDGESFRSLSLDGGKNGNWMLGLEVASSEVKELPVKGYDIQLDGKKHNEEMTKENSYTIEGLSKGPHQVMVSTHYEGLSKPKNSSKVTFIVDVTSGIESIEGTTMEIAQNTGNIEVKGAQVTSIVAYNVAGAHVAASQNNTLNVAHLAAGVYVLKITADGKTVSAKINIK